MFQIESGVLGASPTESLPRAESPADPEHALRTLLAERTAHEQRGRAEAILEASLADAEQRLRRAAQRVADGGLSSHALRRLNAEILASRVPELPAPVSHLPADPLWLYQRYRYLAYEVRNQAVDVAKDGSRAGAQALRRLFRLSAEMVTIQRSLEALQRHMLRIADPGPAPKGVSQLAWNVAWLERAAEKGLLPPTNAVHLANAARAPVAAAGLFSPGRVAFVAYWAGRWALRAGWSWTRRVLSQ